MFTAVRIISPNARLTICNPRNFLFKVSQQKFSVDSSGSEFNAEAEACRREITETELNQSRIMITSGKLLESKIERNQLPGIFYALGFDNGRQMAESDKTLMSRLVPQVEQNANYLSSTELAIISSAMHRAQLAVSDQRLLSALLKSLSSSPESSVALRIMKLLDLSVRRSIPPESLPSDEQLYKLAKSLSSLLLTPDLQPFYGTRVIRFWQKLRISTPDIDSATNEFLSNLFKGEKRPLKSWRVKDISQATFTCGFFANKWSEFAEEALNEIEYRLSKNNEQSIYSSEIANFPDAYFQAVFGLLTHSNCPHFDRIKRIVSEQRLFSRPPSAGARSVEAWRSVRTACGLEAKGQFKSKLDQSFTQDPSERLTGRQYMALQVADAARKAFPRNNVRQVQLLPAFASEAKIDVVIDNVEVDGKKFKVSLLPLPELACYRHLKFLQRPSNPTAKQLVSIYRPQGSELLRLKSIVSAGLVDKALPILWPTWRNLRENNRHAFVRNSLEKLLSKA